MKNFVWNSKQGNRDRSAWCLLIQGDVVHVFSGENIPGVAVVKGESFHKDGKWSFTEYDLSLADNVRSVAGKKGWNNGSFLEGLAEAVSKETPRIWPEVAEALGVSVKSARVLLEGHWPSEAKQLDSVEEALEALDNAEYVRSAENPGEIDVFTISFGSPTNRSIAAGYWGDPVLVWLDGEIVGVLEPEDPKYGHGFRVTEGSERVALLREESSSGMHGGYRTLLIAAPVGSDLWHQKRP